MAAESGVPDPEVNGLSAGPAVTQGPTKLASHFPHELSLSSRAVHADDYINTHQAVAPPLHVSTTFRYPSDPVQLTPLSNFSVRVLGPPPFLASR